MTDEKKGKNYAIRTTRPEAGYTVDGISAITWDTDLGMILFYDTETQGALPVLMVPISGTTVRQL